MPKKLSARPSNLGRTLQTAFALAASDAAARAEMMGIAPIGIGAGQAVGRPKPAAKLARKAAPGKSAARKLAAGKTKVGKALPGKSQKAKAPSKVAGGSASLKLAKRSTRLRATTRAVRRKRA